jgi:hypothetical protein
VPRWSARDRPALGSWLRFPRLAAASLRLIAKLQPRSPLRQAAVSRALQLAVAAYNRRDPDAVTIGFHPDLEY